MGLLKEFKEFAMRGNVIDLAVGVIIGGAFGKIVNSIVTDIIMPPIGYLIGNKSFTDLGWSLKDAQIENGKEVAPAVVLKYGAFIQTVFEFFIIAFSIFIVIRVMNRMTSLRKKQEEAEIITAPEPEPTREEVLLTEIRDLLKNK
jgi:large conductance mechanosensitive channel